MGARGGLYRKLAMPQDLHDELRTFSAFGKETVVSEFTHEGVTIPVYVNEYWTSKQRAASSLQEISYRACYKPQLPRFFITRLTSPGEVVYDPFMGRGTTPLEAGLLGRIPYGCDINPISKVFLRPRLNPPTVAQVEERLAQIPDWTELPGRLDELLTFYHSETLRRIQALKEHLQQGELDLVDDWIQMVATNRLTGHSGGFFSVYTLPPNQATSVLAQRKINEKRGQLPPNREIKPIIFKKTRTLLNRVDPEELAQVRSVASQAVLLTGSADHTPEIPDESVSLIVTSPPFLDMIDYRTDNWLRCWFNALDVNDIALWQIRQHDEWMEAMELVFHELSRVLKPGGYVAFEVGDVRNGKVLMEQLVVPVALRAGLVPELIVINAQKFTKTANCWGVANDAMGTNTNRIIVLRKQCSA